MSALDALPLQAGVSALDAYPLQAGVSALDAYPLQAGVSALDAYPLQTGAAYVIREITIVSYTTFRISETGLVSLLESVDIIVVYNFSEVIYMCAHPQVSLQPHS